MKKKLALIAIKLFAGGLFRDIAEGKRGPKLQALYWRLCGYKRLTGFALAAVLGGMAVADPALFASLAPTLGTVAALFVAWGFLDKGWRTAPPPVEISAAWHSLLAFGPILAAVAALAIEWLPRIPSCGWCADVAGYLQISVAAVGIASGYLAALLTEPPAITDVAK